MTRIQTLAFVAVFVFGSQAAPDAWGQAVQLPTFQYFSVQTTVSVPDRGGAYLGGVSRAASGSVSRGAPLLSKAPGLGPLGRSRAIGSMVGASHAGVTATIIDHRELDAAVLAEARRRRNAAGGAEAPVPGFAPPASDARQAALAPLAAIPEAAPVASVAEIRRRNALEDEQHRQETLALVEKGKQAEISGKVTTARIYYEMAARRADDALRRQIEGHLAALREANERLAARRR